MHNFSIVNGVRQGAVLSPSLCKGQCFKKTLHCNAMQLLVFSHSIHLQELTEKKLASSDDCFRSRQHLAILTWNALLRMVSSRMQVVTKFCSLSTVGEHLIQKRRKTCSTVLGYSLTCSKLILCVAKAHIERCRHLHYMCQLCYQNGRHRSKCPAKRKDNRRGRIISQFLHGSFEGKNSQFFAIDCQMLAKLAFLSADDKIQSFLSPLGNDTPRSSRKTTAKFSTRSK